MDVVPNGYYNHNTGGEHADKIMSDELYVNQLRLKHGLPSSDIPPIDYALDHDGYVMLHQLLPNDPGGANPELAGYVLARKVEQDDSGYSFEVDDLLVDQEQRGLGLGSFLLGKLATQGMWSMRRNSFYYPKSLLVPSGELDAQTSSWLEAKGFAPDGNRLRLQLAGVLMLSVPESVVNRLESTMPTIWNGAIQIEPKGEDVPPRTNVYRQGKFVGHITPAPYPATYEAVNDRGQYLCKFSLHPVDAEPSQGLYSSDTFAIIDLLQQQAKV